MKNPDGSITEERLSERNKLTCEEQATRVVFERFKGKRPDDSEITDLAGSGEMKERVRGLFARIESNAPSDEATTTDTESTPDPKEKRELSPEEMERTLKSLLNRSKQKEYKNLCPTIDWTRAEEALRATPEALWTVHQAKEHEPVIYFADETGFKIGSNLCIESPQATRNCVGHKQAAEWMKKNHPREQFNGDAETQAEDMGWGLITIEEARRFIQNTPPYYEQGWRYYHTPDNIKEIGYPEGPGRALDGARDGDSLIVSRRNARAHYDHRGWGGSLRVNYVS